jgi:predicted small lipoprotein YifL
MNLRLIALLTACAVLAACGHRGPLYIPGKPGDPIYDHEHSGETPANGTPAGTKPLQSSPSPADDNKTNGINDAH